MARTLKEIGERGLVVHEGSEEEGTYRYFNDNPADTWRKFKVSEKAVVTARALDQTKLQTLIEAGESFGVPTMQIGTTELEKLKVKLPKRAPPPLPAPAPKPAP